MDEVWQAFAHAVITLDLDTGPIVIRPDEVGQVGAFPFNQAVHVVTAYNPGGQLPDGSAAEAALENTEQHRRLAKRLDNYDCVNSASSAIDGSFNEPGFAVLYIELAEALALARDFDQLAIYQWTSKQLAIIGVAEPITIELGWSLGSKGIVVPSLAT